MGSTEGRRERAELRQARRNIIAEVELREMGDMDWGRACGTLMGGGMYVWTKRDYTFLQQ